MSVVLRTISAFPSGRTTEELCALLDVDFDNHKREQIRADLQTLLSDGLIYLGHDNKWRLVSRLANSSGLSGLPSPSPEQELISCPARFSIESSVFVDAFEEDEDSADKPDPHSLVRYYRAAVRSDPRGELTQYSDRHGTAFQLISGSGRFWPKSNDESLMAEKEFGKICLSLDSLPDKFREALAKRASNENALAIGWPIYISHQDDVPIIQPVGLISGEWERNDDNTLVVTVERGDVLVNPSWLKEAARNSSWNRNDLADAFRSPDGIGLPVEDFLDRLREVQATSIYGTLGARNFVASLSLNRSGIFNSVGLFLPTDSSFTLGAVRDLEQIASWSTEEMSRTALAPFFGLPSDEIKNSPLPINVGPLNAEQLDAVRSAMSNPFTVVTGPPGTGKSQAIVAMAASALFFGQSVLVASKNHQALDAVEDRLGSIAPESGFVVRTINRSRDTDQSIFDVLRDVVENESSFGGELDEVQTNRLKDLAVERLECLDVLDRIRHLNFELADFHERLAARKREISHEDTEPSSGISWWRRLLIFLGFLGSNQSSIFDAMERGASISEIESAIASRRDELDSIEHPKNPVDLTEEIASLSRTLVSRSLTSRVCASEDLRRVLNDELADLELYQKKDLSRDTVSAVIDHRPLWLASILGTPKRIPLVGGLFDVVIFDEASQCDIGTAIPLLARARRAVVVGDRKQLSFISQLGAARDRNLMAAEGLPAKGMGRYAQSTKSLFDFAISLPSAQKIMLRDQYRSSPAIVDYINAEFYGGKLRSSANTNSFRVPPGTKPGIFWTDVSPRMEVVTEQNINASEVEQISSHLSDLLLSQNYDGSVGVIAPFRSQVHALESKLKSCIDGETWRKSDLRVSTVDGFQGQERDLIIFSPVVHDRISSTAVSFLQRDWRRLNVAISRARAVAHIFGDLSYARSGRIQSLLKLAQRASGSGSTATEGYESHWERIMHYALLSRNLEPRPQYEIAGRRLDFALFGENGAKLDLEVDGRHWHQDIDGNRKTDDIWRDHQMRSLGWRVRRFWVDELERDMEKCLDLIESDLA